MPKSEETMTFTAVPGTRAQVESLATAERRSLSNMLAALVAEALSERVRKAQAGGE